jgi:hypothetical protein
MKSFFKLSFLLALAIVLTNCKSEQTSWEKAETVNTKDGYNKFIANFPNSPHVITASNKIKELEKIRILKEYISGQERIVKKYIGLYNFDTIIGTTSIFLQEAWGKDGSGTRLIATPLIEKGSLCLEYVIAPSTVTKDIKRDNNSVVYPIDQKCKIAGYIIYHIYIPHENKLADVHEIVTRNFKTEISRLSEIIKPYQIYNVYSNPYAYVDSLSFETIENIFELKKLGFECDLLELVVLSGKQKEICTFIMPTYIERIDTSKHSGMTLPIKII